MVKLGCMREAETHGLEVEVREEQSRVDLCAIAGGDTVIQKVHRHRLVIRLRGSLTGCGSIDEVRVKVLA
jgi:hypothetical protein